jgi:hypothetical protein
VSAERRSVPPGSRPGRRLALGPLTMSSAIMCVFLAGCGVSSAPSSNPSSTEASASNEVANEVKIAYMHFWSVTNDIDVNDSAAWRLALQTVAVEPQLSRMVNNLDSLKSRGIAVYGKNVEYVKKIELNGDLATVSDCQDASKSGQADARTGERKTVGIPRNPVSARMQRSPKGNWMVAEISFPRGTC